MANATQQETDRVVIAYKSAEKAAEFAEEFSITVESIDDTDFKIVMTSHIN